VVLDQHQVTWIEVFADPAGSIGEHDHFGAISDHRPNAANNVARLVSLVEMDTALHRAHGDALKPADHETAAMTCDTGLRHMRQVCERRCAGVLEVFGKFTEPRAEHEPDSWRDFESAGLRPRFERACQSTNAIFFCVRGGGSSP
jgi:hypothetical protein